MRIGILCVATVMILAGASAYAQTASIAGTIPGVPATVTATNTATAGVRADTSTTPNFSDAPPLT